MTQAKAVRYAHHGGPEVLTLDEVPLPEPGPGQVRVAVRAAGVNGIDWKIRRGLMSRRPPDGPVGTGVEVAGLVDAVGPGVAEWHPGQAVFGRVPVGAAATHVLAAADDLLAKPDRLSFVPAAALPIAVETAHRTLRLLGVRSGQILLIHAVAGGVGLAAAQLARSRGVNVIGTASERNHTFLRELGVTPVTYGDGLADRVRAVAAHGVDAVLDASGRGVLPVSIELAGGPDHVITIADPRADEYGVRFSGGAGDLREVFAEVLPLVESGVLRIPVERTFPLEHAADAYRLSEEGHLRGKIVITVEAPG